MSQPTESVIIVGAGIVGSSLAYFLSQSSTPRAITLIDRSFTSLLGSSGIAPGFVGQFNESEVLTKLAIDTVSEYVKIPGGFDRVGGLEIAFQELVNEDGEGQAVFFEKDGTANAVKITTWYQQEAKKHGVNFVEADVKQLTISEGSVTGIDVVEIEASRHLTADKVILTTGIWAQGLSSNLPFPVPVIPVGHPYIHAQPHEPLPHKIPFVRWPEHHVYARDHGTNFGIGSYDHAPIGYKPDTTAKGEWLDWFKQPLDFATGLLPPAAAREFQDGNHFNGVFSMTPDNMPLAGKVESVEGLFMAVAVWVTHAAGTAKVLTRIIDGEEVDGKTREALDPERFRGQDFAQLEEKSLTGYNSIYKTIKSGSA
ncbi:hypothetical protein AU210_004563 [Fusarium oxysporum f. sp. radicis-cucumerinum]|uniref:FAD dependent oxidoreductase domain-containing protein n=1 Tax=Fusarium oxysporum f. sp. radicis-cucumerinum TaxID=327505 RepID=A0A2H3HHY3_FUSOX|nr:hypothetical protein AU210_004563 [Fusarium oxysporum f. sp. radicis-cucumerinum]